MKYSLKQMARTPLKSAVFFLLTALCAAILTIGLSLWLNTTEKIRQAEEQFTTIGTVTQKPDATGSFGYWDAEIQDYAYSSYPQYDSILSVDVLNVEGVEYLSGPERRPWYGAYLPQYDYDDYYNNLNRRHFTLVEFSPVEDCVPDHPVLVNVERVLAGTSHLPEQILFCDHRLEHPAPLEAGKTYIAYISGYFSDFFHAEVQDSLQLEYVPWIEPYSKQYDAAGNLLESDWFTSDDPTQFHLEEVTEDFYTSGLGQYWLNRAEGHIMHDDTFPVLPTDDLNLLPAFHSRSVSIWDGREITEEEFEQGACVCLVNREFAWRNNLAVGDTITLPLYFSNYNGAAKLLDITFTSLNAEGEPFSPFWEADYEIVGLYTCTAAVKAAMDTDDTEIGRGMFIIPAGSVEGSDENNIMDYGPMMAANTSFQIPNGSIEEVERQIAALPESEFLDIQFDDNGYSQVVESLENTRTAAGLLLAGGLLSALAVLSLLLYFSIVRQKKRTCIERALGMTKGQCRVSLISGMLLLVIAAAVVGSVLSGTLATQIQEAETETESAFSMKYSQWTRTESAVELLAESSDTEESASVAVDFTAYLVVPVVLTVFVAVASLVLVEGNLRVEPMEALGSRED